MGTGGQRQLGHSQLSSEFRAGPGGLRCRCRARNRHPDRRSSEVATHARESLTGTEVERRRGAAARALLVSLPGLINEVGVYVIHFFFSQQITERFHAGGSDGTPQHDVLERGMQARWEIA